MEIRREVTRSQHFVNVEQYVKGAEKKLLRKSKEQTIKLSEQNTRKKKLVQDELIFSTSIFKEFNQTNFNMVSQDFKFEGFFEERSDSEIKIFHSHVACNENVSLQIFNFSYCETKKFSDFDFIECFNCSPFSFPGFVASLCKDLLQVNALLNQEVSLSEESYEIFKGDSFYSTLNRLVYDLTVNPWFSDSWCENVVKFNDFMYTFFHETFLRIHAFQNEVINKLSKDISDVLKKYHLLWLKPTFSNKKQLVKKLSILDLEDDGTKAFENLILCSFTPSIRWDDIPKELINSDYFIKDTTGQFSAFDRFNYLIQQKFNCENFFPPESIMHLILSHFQIDTVYERHENKILLILPEVLYRFLKDYFIMVSRSQNTPNRADATPFLFYYLMGVPIGNYTEETLETFLGLLPDGTLKEEDLVSFWESSLII